MNYLNNMFGIIKKSNFIFGGLILIIVFLFGVWSHPSLTPKIAPDSYAYINIAENFNHQSNALRPFTFPIFIRICMFLADSNWKIFFSIIQIVIHASLCVVLFLFFQRF